MPVLEEPRGMQRGMETVTMSKRDFDRAGVIQRVLGKQLTQREAARALGLTDRQVRRLCKCVLEDGPAGLANRARGRPRATAVARKAFAARRCR